MMKVVPENMVRTSLNYEKLRNGELSIRKDPVVFDSDLDTLVGTLFDPLFFTTRRIFVWYPNHMPSDADSGQDYIIFVYGKSTTTAYGLHMFYKVSGTWSYQDADNDDYLIDLTNTDILYTVDSQLKFFAGSDKLLIADGVNLAHYIKIDQWGNINCGALNLPPPLYFADPAGKDENNTYLATGYDETGITIPVTEGDIGMGIPRGSLYRMCYTVVMKNGDETPPSPILFSMNFNSIATVEADLNLQDMQFLYPEPVATLEGFKYYWVSRKYLNLAVPDKFTADMRNEAEYFNIYRQDFPFAEGNLDYGDMMMVKSVPIVNKTAGNDVKDKSLIGLTVLPANTNTQIISKTVAEIDGIVFLGNIKTKVPFPVPVEYYVPIKIDNNNAVNYTPGIIEIFFTELDFKDIAGAAWVSHGFYNDAPSLFRVFDSDTMTPLRFSMDNVANTATGGMVQVTIFRVIIPLILQNSIHTIFLAYLTETPASPWNTVRYGLTGGAVKPFCFVRNDEHILCINVNDILTEDTAIRNRANMGVPMEYTDTLLFGSAIRRTIGIDFCGGSSGSEVSIKLDGTPDNVHWYFPARYHPGGINKFNFSLFFCYREEPESLQPFCRLANGDPGGMSAEISLFRSYYTELGMLVLWIGEEKAGEDDLNLSGNLYIDFDAEAVGYENTYFVHWGVDIDLKTCFIHVFSFRKELWYSKHTTFSVIDILPAELVTPTIQMFHYTNTGTSKLYFDELNFEETYDEDIHNCKQRANNASVFDDFIGVKNLYCKFTDVTLVQSGTIYNPHCVLTLNGDYHFMFKDCTMFKISFVDPNPTTDYWDDHPEETIPPGTVRVFDESFSDFVYGISVAPVAFSTNSTLELTWYSYNTLQYGVPTSYTITGFVVQTNITKEPLVKNTWKGYENLIQFSKQGGVQFPSTYLLKAPAPVLEIAPSPSFLPMQYQNTLIIWMRNGVSRFVANSDDPAQWINGLSPIILEQRNKGLLALRSLIRTGSAFFWLSEAGVVMWDANGIRAISKDIIDVPLIADMLGLYLPLRDQFLLNQHLPEFVEEATSTEDVSTVTLSVVKL